MIEEIIEDKYLMIYTLICILILVIFLFFLFKFKNKRQILIFLPFFLGDSLFFIIGLLSRAFEFVNFSLFFSIFILFGMFLEYKTDKIENKKKNIDKFDNNMKNWR